MSGERRVELSADEAEKFLLSRVEDAKGDPVDSLWQLVRFNNTTGRHVRALDGLRRIMALLPDAERSATCPLAMGQTMEEIEVDFTRPNGHKNLGLALAGQGRTREAAQSYVTATRVNAADRRSYDHLARLLADHPELKPEWGADAEWCLQAFGDAADEAEQSQPLIHRGFWKPAFLLQLRLRRLFGRRRLGV